MVGGNRRQIYFLSPRAESSTEERAGRQSTSRSKNKAALDRIHYALRPLVIAGVGVILSMATSTFDLAEKTLAALVAGLEKKHAGEDGVTETVARLNAQNYTQCREPTAAAKRDPACRYLAAGLAAAWHVDKNVSATIGDLTPLLHWQRIPEHVPRPPGAFMDDYAYAHIIGPNGVYPGDDFMLGLFIIGPGQLYPAHLHAAPELYWLFSGPTQWRYSIEGAWTRKKAGELQWNKPQQIHAMRTLNVPLFAIWAWTHDIDGDFRILGANGTTPLNRPAES